MLILTESEACYIQKLPGPPAIFLYNGYSYMEYPHKEVLLYAVRTVSLAGYSTANGLKLLSFPFPAEFALHQKWTLPFFSLISRTFPLTQQKTHSHFDPRLRHFLTPRYLPILPQLEFTVTSTEVSFTQSLFRPRQNILRATEIPNCEITRYSSPRYVAIDYDQIGDERFQAAES